MIDASHRCTRELSGPAGTPVRAPVFNDAFSIR